MDDSKIIDLFFERSERAIVELSKKYEKICMKISMNILNNYEDSEECVNDSYLGIWNTIPPKRPNPLLAFLLRLVRNRCMDKLDYKLAAKRDSTYTACLDEFEWCIESNHSVETEIEAKLLSSYIDEFLDSLDKTNRMVFVRRYWFMDSYKDISSLSGLSEGAIRTRLSRLREDLRLFLKERGIAV